MTLLGVIVGQAVLPIHLLESRVGLALPVLMIRFFDLILCNPYKYLMGYRKTQHFVLRNKKRRRRKNKRTWD